MSLRLTARVRAFAATATLFAGAACASDSQLATAPTDSATLARGGSSTPSAVAVAGTWTATTLGGTSALVDSVQWSLFLTQKDSNLEGSLIRINYLNNGTSLAGVSAIKRGSISGTSVYLEFDRGEGAETATTFGATVSDDGRSMTGFHSRYPGSVTLVKR
jgi:hypothetical protein